MSSHGGFITLHRKIMDWEWYKNINTRILFIHLLLLANYENSRFMGKTIKRGQVVTSLQTLSTSACLSIRQTRTALDHLILTGEVTNKSTNQYRIITIVKYDDYQNLTNELTGKRQATDKQPDKQPTNKTTTSEQYKQINQYPTPSKDGVGEPAKRFIPPTLEEVETYVREKGFAMKPDAFFDHYSMSGWLMKGGQKIKDWKAAVRQWERREKNGFERHGDAGTKPKPVDYSCLFKKG